MAPTIFRFAGERQFPLAARTRAAGVTYRLNRNGERAGGGHVTIIAVIQIDLALPDIVDVPAENGLITTMTVGRAKFPLHLNEAIPRLGAFS